MAKKSYRSDMHRRQRTKNFALLVALLAFVVIVFFVSLVRMGGL
jgi:hypothetical protein